ncbi:hypothetical protein J6590_091908 [Homalodisca vitripennis]|nr:hypothetical protein J6590_091908 [Homalodisca vitripennis]
MDGEVSDLDLTDDEDADPNFQPEEAIQRVQSSSDDDSELEIQGSVAAVSPAQQMTQAADTLRLVANVSPAPQVILPAQTARDQTDQTRYFTSEYLLDLLHSECGGTGILQKQRIPLNSKLKENKEMRKKEEEQ